MFNLVLEKPEEPEIKLTTSVGLSQKQENSRKTPISALLTMPEPLTMWITTNCGKFFKRWEYQITFLPPEKSVCRSRSNRTNTEQQTGSKLGKECAKAVLLSPCLFNLNAEYIMQNAGLEEGQAGIKIAGEIPITSDTQVIPPYGRK